MKAMLCNEETKKNDQPNDVKGVLCVDGTKYLQRRYRFYVAVRIFHNFMKKKKKNGKKLHFLNSVTEGGKFRCLF